MSVKEIKEAMDAGNVLFGIKQALKGSARGIPSKAGTSKEIPSSSGKLKQVFIAKDARDDTVEKLEAADVEFDVLKPKADLAKELNLDFECEVFSVK